MSSSTRFSIVIPTLQAGRFLAHALRSIEEQRCTACEVIVVDGGSTDDTHQIVETSALPTRWVDLPGSSQVEAINHGFGLASGEILAWLNADDLLWPDALSAVAGYLDAHRAVDILYGDAIAIDARDRCFGRRRHVRCGAHDDLLRDDFIVQPASFWRRSVWEDHGPLRAEFAYVFDYDFYLRVSSDRALTYLPIPLAAERLHADRKSTRGSLERIEELRRLGRRHGLDDLPVGFVGQAVVEYVLGSLRAIHRRDVRTARRVLADAPDPRRQPVNAAARLLLTLPAGHRGFLRALLWVTAVESMMHRRPLRPGPAQVIT